MNKVYFTCIIALMAALASGCITDGIEAQIDEAQQICEDVAKEAQREAIESCQETIEEQIAASEAWCEEQISEEIDSIKEWFEELLSDLEEEVLSGLGCTEDDSDLGWDCKKSDICEGP
jgi:hypothetical protein